MVIDTRLGGAGAVLLLAKLGRGHQTSFQCHRQEGERISDRLGSGGDFDGRLLCAIFGPSCEKIRPASVRQVIPPGY
jgi:hypothetical protein